MKKINSQRGKSVYKTNYNPKTGFNQIMKLLKGKVEFLKGGKNLMSNSYYIEAGNDDYSKNIEIRVSDHTKFLDDLLGEKHMLILKQTKTDLQLDIVSQENFDKAISILKDFIK